MRQTVPDLIYFLEVRPLPALFGAQKLTVWPSAYMVTFRDP